MLYKHQKGVGIIEGGAITCSSRARYWLVSWCVYAEASRWVQRS